MAVKTKIEEPTELDPFRDFSFTETLAFTYKTAGNSPRLCAAGLASFFSDFDDPDIRKVLTANNLGDVRLTRELLTDVADELDLMRLDKCAALVRAEAERRPSGLKPHQRQRWQQQRSYYLATGKRQITIPPESTWQPVNC